MSSEAKEQRKRDALQLAGQDSEEARAAVKLQRELKKKRDAQRKAEKKLKALSPEHADYAAAKDELDAVAREVAALEAAAAAATTTAAAGGVAPDVRDASTAAPATAAATTVNNSSNDNNNKGGSDRNAKEQTEGSEAAEATRQRLLSLVEQARMASRVERMAVAPRASVVHPRVAEVAIMMAEMRIVGGNARTLALLHAFRELLAHTTVLAASSLRDVDTTAFEQLIEANFAFVRSRREATSGMRYVKRVLVRRFVALRDAAVRCDAAAAEGNGHDGRPVDVHTTATSTAAGAAREVAVTRDGGGKATSSAPSSVATTAAAVAAASSSSADYDLGGDAREVALRLLATIELELKVSLKSIVEERSLPYVSSSDSILVFGRSSAVEAVLLARARSAQHKPRHVYVVDSAPLFEGRTLAQRLCDAGMDVTYSLITSCCTLMPRCTRVFLGAAAVLQNGDVFSRCGTALVAACAKSLRKPVLCFCESYKFVPAVWLGNLAQNTKLRDVQAAQARHERIASSMTATAGVACGERSPLRQLSPLPPTTPSPTHYAPSAWSAWGNKSDAATPSGGGGGAAADAAAASAPSRALSASASGYLYDLTPAAYIDMIICEMGCLHTSAIVAALRDRESRDAAPHLYMEKHT